jgi:hypothetical protein
MSTSTTRRRFLRGAAGFTLALPFLPSLAGRAAAGAGGPAKRFVAFRSLQGQFQENWFPSVMPTTMIEDSVAAMSLRDIPGPISRVVGSSFDGLRDKLSLLIGLDGLSRAFGHNNCFPLTASTFGNGTGEGGVPPVYPRSLDVVLEDSPTFYPTPVPEPVLRVDPNTGSPPSWAQTTSLSWRDSVMIPAKWDSRVVFNRLFGGAAPGDVVPTFDPRERERLVIDRVKADFDRVRASSRLSTDDRHRLDNYAELLQGVHRRMASVPVISCDGPTQIVEETHDAAYSNHIDIMVAALACGITKVATMYCHHHASDGNDRDLHGFSHHLNDDAPALHASCYDWISARYLELITKLDSVVEPDGTTLLDNSAVLWGNDIGICNGSGHYQFRAPVMVAGGLQGTLRTGVVIDYRTIPMQKWAGHEHLGRPYNQLLTTLMAALGLTPEEWELPGRPGFGDYSCIGDPYADGAYDRYIGRERDYLPHYYLG